MQFADVNGHRLCYTDSGGDKPVLVFSHGFLLDKSIWDPHVAALSSDYRCIAWDARGHGMSDCRGDFDFWDAGRDALGLLDHLGIDRAVLIGLSQGGFLSFRAALTAPERVEAVIIVNSAVRVFGPEEHEGFSQASAAWTTGGPVGPIAEMMAGIQFGADYDWSEWLHCWQAKPPVDWKATWNSQLSRDDITSRLPDIACPVGFVHGAADAAFSLEHAQEMNAAVRTGLGVEAIEGAPHACVVTHPAQTIAAIKALLQKLR